MHSLTLIIPFDCTQGLILIHERVKVVKHDTQVVLRVVALLLREEATDGEWRLELKIFLPYQLASCLALFADCLAVFGIEFASVENLAQIHYSAVLLHE